MKLQKYGCGLIPKFSCNDDEIVEAYIWVSVDDPYEIHDIAHDAGYEVVDNYETDEVLDVEDDEIEDFERLEFDNDED